MDAMAASVDSRFRITPQELSECDREPLHHIGNIQGSSGHLLMFEYPCGKITAHDRDIRQVEWIRHRDGATMRDSVVSEGSFEGSSQGSLEYCPDQEHISLLGTYMHCWIPYNLYMAVNDIVEDMKKARSRRAFHFYTYRQCSYALSFSTTEEDISVVAVEIETQTRNEQELTDANTLVHLGRISEFYAHESIAFTACDTIFDLFREHFDRGMVYRFLDDASGEVIHEITSFDMKTSYLGLRFPASDIPLSARQLYIKNGLRYIHDVDTENVPVVSSSGDQDLTQVRMRGVAKPHILYLSNMGVKCSMSVAIVVNGDLWGLLVFHGYQKPFKPALHQRIACETICKMVSVRIEALAKKEQSQRIIELGQALMTMKYNRSILENMYELGEGILKVLDCEVVIAFKEALSYDAHNNFVVIGDNSLVPTEDFWKRLLSLARNREIVSISGRQSLSDAGISMKECPASGFAFFREGATHFFIGRKERSRDVVWAGKPDEPKLRIGGILTPRTSFETYMEKARVEARGWSSQDMNVLSVFRDRICDHCHNWTMSLLQNDIEQMNKKYMDAIDRAQQNYGFFARMSHELRTPFHGVMGCLDILDESIEEMPSNEAKSLVATAIASGNHMLNLLNDILDISKNKHLTHTQARERTVYQSLAFDTIDCMKSLATSKKIQLEFDILPTSDNNTIIATDRTKVIQIVSNIVNNAIKFTGKGRISVNFKLLESIQEGIDEWQKSASLYEGIAFTMKEGEMITSLEEVKKRVAHEVFYPDQRWMCVSVTDNGCGMNASELVDMFEPYTQGRGNRPKMGTGLGLFICVSLCLQLKGFLCCASSPGGGTIFQFGIPVDLETDELEDETITRPSSPSEHEPEPFIVMSGPIMVVDDNIVNVKLLKRTLERQLKLCNLDLEVLIATGGVAAVELYKEKRPSLCIVDYHMPEKDGVEVAKDIRKWEEEHDRQPSFILSYTADATEEAKYLILEQANDIMTKPPPKGYIQGLVRRLKVD